MSELKLMEIQKQALKYQQLGIGIMIALLSINIILLIRKK